MASQKAMINTMLFYHWDNTLFNDMQIPAGVDKDLVVSAILEETSDFPVLITDLETLRFSIEQWSRHRVDIWAKMLETTRYEYNPIENYDRTETENSKTTHTGSGTVKGDGGEEKVVASDSNNRTDNHTQKRTGNDSQSHGGNDVQKESVAAFNSAGMTDHTTSRTDYNTTNRTDYDITDTYNGTIGDSGSSTSTRTNKHGETETRNFSDDYTKDIRIHGNIGVMTTQQMIQQERDIIDYDIIDIIVKEYKKKFCILIY